MFWKYIKKHYASELDEQMYPGMPDDRVKKKKKKFGISTKESMERTCYDYLRNLTYEKMKARNSNNNRYSERCKKIQDEEETIVR